MLTHSWFYQADLHQGQLLHGHHHYVLLLVSVLVAIAASWLGLQVAGLARQATTTPTRQGALISGAMVLGGGIWAMHFIGMLSFTLPLPVRYDQATTLLSMLPAMAASLLALHLLARPNLDWRIMLSGGVLIGAGIGMMHYYGMTAMRMDALLRFDPLWFFASLIIAVAMAVLALWVRFGLGHESRTHLLIAAIVMGLAISSMHYAGMAAARFVGSAQPDFVPQLNDQENNGLLIAFAVVVFGGLVGVINAMVRFSQLYQRVQANTERIRSIADTAIDAIITWDTSGIIEEANHAAESLFGWPRDELVGQHIDILLPEDSAAQTHAFLQDFSNAGHPPRTGMNLETWCRRRNGTLFPVRVALGQATLKGRNHFVGFISDITERHLLEKSLREREEQYRSLIANIPGVTFRCLPREDWRMLFISDAVEQMTGWPAERFLSGELSFADLIHPDDSDFTVEHVMGAIGRREKHTLEYRIFHRDGQLRWVCEYASAIFDEQGNAEWIDGVIIDITDAKLRNAEFKGIVRAISQAQGMADIDLDGRIIFSNRRFIDLSGYPAEQLEGRHLQQLLVSGQFDPQQWQKVREGEYLAGEYTLRHANGSSIHTQIYFNPIIDAYGRPAKVVMLVTDLSERHRMELALLAAKERAELAAESKGAFLANMSHEIRTPMNAIIGFSEVLLNESLSSTQRKYLKTVNQSARSLLGLLNDILDTAKLEKGAVQLEEHAFSLRDLCRQLINVFSLEAGQKGLALEFDYHAQQEHYRGDPMRVRQVLTNLLGNAIKFTRQGSVRLQVDADSDGVCLRISDTGIGIEPERIQQIFEPFAQADASMSRRFGGTGLGTTIARQLVELMGGEIRVSSVPEQGSTFAVRLPLEPLDDLTAQLANKTAGNIELPPLRILVADDVAENVQLMEVMLRAEGHRVYSAGNGLSAFERVVDDRFDLILMDMQMPEVDGLEATRIIRRYEANMGYPPTPIIALTASVLDRDREAARAAGMEGFASKPVDREALKREIARVLGLQLADEVSLKPATARGPQLVDWYAGEQRWGDRQALIEAIQRFLADLPARLAELEQALQQPSAEQARSLVHRINGSAGNLSLQQLQQAAAELEKRLTQTPTPALADALHALLTAAEQTRAAMPEPGQRRHHKSHSTLSREQRQHLVDNLITVLNRGEVNEQALQQLADTLEQDKRQALEQALDNFDFATAISLLEAERSLAATETEG